MSALDQRTNRKLTCGETESIVIGDGIEVTVLEVDGNDVVLRIDGVEESRVVVVEELAASF